MRAVIVGYAHKTVREGRRLARALVKGDVERKARQLRSVAPPSASLRIPVKAGWKKFQLAELAGAGDALGPLQALAQQWKSNPDHIDRKSFPHNLLTSSDVVDIPLFLDLALHDDIIGSITEYFDQVPRLFNLALWWSPPNQTAKGSQLYHHDHRDSRQAKLFLNINDVTLDAGPLHFLPADCSTRVDDKLGYSQDRYTDEDVYSVCSKKEVVAAVGHPGTAFLVDTARCLHYGSRGNIADRLILMASFARANCVKPGPGCRVMDPIRQRLATTRYAHDPLRQFILTIATK
jgi:hypothetical protein